MEATFRAVAILGSSFGLIGRLGGLGSIMTVTANESDTSILIKDLTPWPDVKHEWQNSPRNICKNKLLELGCILVKLIPGVNIQLQSGYFSKLFKAGIRDELNNWQPSDQTMSTDGIRISNQLRSQSLLRFLPTENEAIEKMPVGQTTTLSLRPVIGKS